MYVNVYMEIVSIYFVHVDMDGKPEKRTIRGEYGTISGPLN